MEPIQPSKSSIAYQPTTLGGTSDLGRLANHPHLKEEEKMEAVAKEFEVMLVKQVLKSAQQPMTDSGSTFFPNSRNWSHLWGHDGGHIVWFHWPSGTIGIGSNVSTAIIIHNPRGNQHRQGPSENNLKSKGPQ